MQTPNSTILAGTEHGIYLLKDSLWQRVGDLPATSPTKPAPVVAKRPSSKRRPLAHASAPLAVSKSFDGSIYGFALAGDTLFAATSQGLLSSSSNGQSWALVSSVAIDEWRYIAASKANVVVATLDDLAISFDGGGSWHALARPEKLSQITALSIDAAGDLWVADRDAVYYSTDRGTNWHTLPDLYARNIDSIYFDETANRMLITSIGPTTDVFAVAVPSMRVTWWDAGWKLRFVRPVGDYLLAATLFDGIVVQPRMVDSSELAQH